VKKLVAEILREKICCGNFGVKKIVAKFQQEKNRREISA
jgi:hypothetical protein